VPVPRRFDRRLPERDTTRINDRIRVPEVRLVGEDGKQIGVIKTADALIYAQERDLDLVEVAPEARPPVCRVLDYSKYKYEQAQKLKAARKHQQQITIREIKFRPKIAQADYDTKKGHVERFLKGKDKVKVTIMFRGREVTHPERGTALLTKLAEELAEVGVVEQTPLQDGRNMTMMLAPSKAALASEDEHHSHPDEHDHEKKLRRQQREQLTGDGSVDTGDGSSDANGPEPAAEATAPAPEPVAEAPVAPEPAAAPVAEAPAPTEPEPEPEPAVAEPEHVAVAQTPAKAQPKAKSPNGTKPAAAKSPAAPKPPAKPRAASKPKAATTGD
jgi:translation initiation factor IF-3